MKEPKGTRLVARQGADSKAKRGAKVADRIVEDVTSLGWPVGEVLGPEAELLDRYHVSRAVFREAVRLVEHQQVARTRRGPGGGLVITEPTVGAVTDAVVLYLLRVDARLDEIYEARIVLAEIACGLASEQTEAHDRAELRQLARHEAAEPAAGLRDLHALVAAVSRNAGLELFVDVLSEVAALYSPRGNAPATPRPGTRGRPTRRSLRPSWLVTGSWPAPACARISRLRSTSSSAAARPANSFPSP